LNGQTAMVMDAVFSLDGKHIATASLDGSIRIWKTNDGALEHILTGHDKAVWEVQYSQDGLQLGSVGTDATLRIWGTGNGSLLKTIPTEADELLPNGLIFALDGRSVLLAYSCFWPDVCPANFPGDLRRIDLESGQIDILLDDRVTTFTASADQSIFGIFSARGAQSGDLLSHNLRSYVSPMGTGELAGSGIAPDGSLFFSCNAYGLHVWNAVNGELIAILPGVSMDIDGDISVTETQQLVIVHNWEGLIWLWGI
jgi:WD40 repeat protein